MASSRRTYDTDVITLRTVFAKNVVNSNIPALRVLTADGAGGTYWAIPSSLGLNPSFNEIITSAATYTADLSYNRFRLLAGEGVGMVNGLPGSNQTTLFGKSFQILDVSGDNSFFAFSNNTLNPFIRVATTGSIQARSDPATNTLFIDGPVSNPYLVSTGQYGFYQIKVTPQTSTITSTVQGLPGDFITASSPSTLLRMIGYEDIQLSTNVTTNSIFFTISTFTSKGYLDISAAAFSAFGNALSSVSSLYVTQTNYNSTIAGLSSSDGITFSTLQSSINGLAISTGDQFYILTGLINARATIIQLNSEIATVNLNMRSTVEGLGSAGYLSTALTFDSLRSTVEGLGSSEYVSTAMLQSSLVSTVAGLGGGGGGGGSGVFYDVQVASTLQYSPYFSSVKLGFNAGYTSQGDNAIAIGNEAGSNSQGTNSIAIGKNAGAVSQAPSSIVISALGDPLNASTEGLFVAPLRKILDTYDFSLTYNSTTHEVAMINPILPCFSDTCPFDSNAPGSMSYNQMLFLTDYTWNFGPGASSYAGCNYRVTVSWCATGIASDISCYFILSNNTQSNQYTGSIYGNPLGGSNGPFTCRTIVDGGTNFNSGSFTDILKNVTLSNGDLIRPLLYMKTPVPTTPVGGGSKFMFMLELAKQNF